MSWARLDDRCHEHPKQVAAGPEACWLWACGLQYANRQKSRDGFIPKVQIFSLFAGIKSPKKLAKKLVEVGLWEEEKDGFRIHDYHCWNQTREQRNKELQQGRDRAAQSYSKKRDNSTAEESLKNSRRITEENKFYGNSPGSTTTPLPLPAPNSKDDLVDPKDSYPLRVGPLARSENGIRNQPILKTAFSDQPTIGIEHFNGPAQFALNAHDAKARSLKLNLTDEWQKFYDHHAAAGTLLAEAQWPRKFTVWLNNANSFKRPNSILPAGQTELSEAERKVKHDAARASEAAWEAGADARRLARFAEDEKLVALAPRTQNRSGRILAQGIGK